MLISFGMHDWMHFACAAGATDRSAADDRADGNGAVGHVEGRKRPVPLIDLNEIRDGAVHDAVVEISDCAAQYQSQSPNRVACAQ